ncbi:MAG: hypothetical protein ACSHW7_08280 [Patiriisocius sp.]|uniref:hypothetical protein n=1 Tax=Patiriisocius sp. TaxID=2822396 RepID=UPI003EFAB254
MNSNYSDLNISSLIKLADIDTRKIDKGVESVHFTINLDPLFLDTFELLNFQIAINNGEYVLDDDNDVKIIRARFSTHSDLLDESQMKLVTNSAMQICQIKDDYWTGVDYMRILSGVWRGRTIIEHNISIELDENGNFILEILNLNYFIKRLASN